MPSATLEFISFAGIIISGIAIIVSGVFVIRRIMSKTGGSGREINSKNIFAVSAFFFYLFERIFFAGGRWIPFLTALVISAAALVFLYYLYQREYFWFAVLTAAGCFFLYFAETPLLSDIYRLFFRILLAAAAVLIFILAVVLMKNKGRLKNIKILGADARYFQFFVLAGLIAAISVLGFLPVTLIYLSYFYLICAMTGWLIIAGVYFTVKMI